MIPMKNYIKVVMLCFISVVIALICASIYLKNQEHVKTIPVIRGTLNEIITAEELDNYIMENNNAIIYIGVANDDNCREVEKELIKLLKKKSLTEEVVYLNVTEFDNIDRFYSDFNSKYGTDMKITHYPSFMIFADGKILNMVSKTDKQDLQVGDIDILLDQYELAN